MIDLSSLAKALQWEHEQRLDVADHVPLERKGRRTKKTPRTALISRAAKRAAEGKW